MNIAIHCAGAIAATRINSANRQRQLMMQRRTEEAKRRREAEIEEENKMREAEEIWKKWNLS